MTPAARLRCAASHIAAVRRMVEEDAPCRAVLLQLLAVQGSLRAVAQLLIAEEIRRAARDEGIHEAARLVEQMGTRMVGSGRRRSGASASASTRPRQRSAQ